MAENLMSWLALYAVPGLGPAAFTALLKHFETPEKILSATEKTLCAVPGIGQNIARSVARKHDWDFAHEQLRRAQESEIEIITLSDSHYPQILTQIYAPPPLLFARGDITVCHAPTIAIVGSRSFTNYGRETAQRLARDLAGAGVTVISGMAIGIDTYAHKGALENGATAAVLGSSLDCPYPSENRTLFRQIGKQGVVLSEFPLGTGPEPHNFPRRNRIISGLSLGCVVVEAGTRSGALITAQFALDHNRDVFAIPGPIHSGKSIGPNKLLQQGAILVQSAEDILCEITPHYQPSLQTPEPSPPELSQEEQAIWDALDGTPVHIDDLARQG
ncbi:MAG: DNA-processing protein DprA [Candidatus Latescibacteria bacterium]|nr:DNA-processing protein DprA [Candidatus Latescibacterota bacterium]